MSQNNTVISNLWKKKSLLESGDPRHKTIRPLLLILGGGNLGVYSAAACYAFHLLGLGSVFDTVVGISTGAWVGGYYLASKEQIKIGTSTYYEEFATSEYISIKKIPYLMNASLIEKTTSAGCKKLDVEAVRKSRSQLLVGVTDTRGEGCFLDAKSASPSFLSAMYASSATPLAYHTPREVNGNAYFDGGIALVFPIKKVIEEFSPTDVMVLPNYQKDQSRNPSFFERAFIKLFLTHFPGVVRQKMLLWHENFWAGAEFAANAHNVHVLWPPGAGIHSLTRNPKKLRGAAYASARQTLKELGRPELEVKLY